MKYDEFTASQTCYHVRCYLGVGFRKTAKVLGLLMHDGHVGDFGGSICDDLVGGGKFELDWYT